MQYMVIWLISDSWPDLIRTLCMCEVMVKLNFFHLLFHKQDIIQIIIQGVFNSPTGYI